MGIAEVIRYAISQVIWLVVEAIELVSAMGIGLRWIFMTARCLTFAILDLVFFLPNVVWYIFSPNIIRRVSYRASMKTKKRNFRKLVKLLQKVNNANDNAVSPSPPRSSIGLSCSTGSLPSLAASPHLKPTVIKGRSMATFSPGYSAGGGNAEAPSFSLEKATGVSAFFSSSTRLPYGSSQPTPSTSVYGSPLNSFLSREERRAAAGEMDSFTGSAVDTKKGAQRNTKVTPRRSFSNEYPTDECHSSNPLFVNPTQPMATNKADLSDDFVDNHWMPDGTYDEEVNAQVRNSRSSSVSKNVWQFDEDGLADDAEILNRTLKLSKKIFKTRDSLDDAFEMLQHSFRYKGHSGVPSPSHRRHSSSSSADLPVEPLPQRSVKQKEPEGGVEEQQQQAELLPPPHHCRTNTGAHSHPFTAASLPDEEETLDEEGDWCPPVEDTSSPDHHRRSSRTDEDASDSADGGELVVSSSTLDRETNPDGKILSPVASDQTMPPSSTPASITTPSSTLRDTDRHMERPQDETPVEGERKQGRASKGEEMEAARGEEEDENEGTPELSSIAFSKRPTPIQAARKTPVTRFISKMKASLQRFSPLRRDLDTASVRAERQESKWRVASPSPSPPNQGDYTPPSASRSASQTSDFVQAVSESWKTYKWKHGERHDCSDSESSDEDDEDVNNLHNRAHLDIYLPVGVDSLFRAMNEEHRRRAEGDATFKVKKFPIVIIVNGGAWIVGCYIWNFLIARVLASRGYVVFCPDYRNFPQATMEGMTLDVSDAIAWVLRNAERYNGDLEDVTLMGQSAGAHLTMMSLLSQAQWFGFKAKGGKLSSLTPPSSVAYNVPRYNPRASIRRYIGISGIYNVRHLVKHLNKRGLYRHVLHKIAGGKENMPRYSLNSYFDPSRQAETGEVLPDNIFDFLPSQMYFLHGDADCSAPVTESSLLVSLLRVAQAELRAKKKALQLASLPVHPSADLYRKDDSSKIQGDELQKKGGSCSSAVSASVPPVEIKFILCPGVNHTDSIIEEPLAVGDSHVAEFLQYERANSNGKEWSLTESQVSTLPSAARNVSSSVSSSGETLGRHVSFSLNPENSATLRCPCSVTDPAPPDMILPSSAPPSSRPLFLRAGSMVCPF